MHGLVQIPFNGDCQTNLSAPNRDCPTKVPIEIKLLPKMGFVCFGKPSGHILKPGYVFISFKIETDCSRRCTEPPVSQGFLVISCPAERERDSADEGDQICNTCGYIHQGSCVVWCLERWIEASRVIRYPPPEASVVKSDGLRTLSGNGFLLDRMRKLA